MADSLLDIALSVKRRERTMADVPELQRSAVNHLIQDERKLREHALQTAGRPSTMVVTGRPRNPA